MKKALVTTAALVLASSQAPAMEIQLWQAITQCHAIVSIRVDSFTATPFQTSDGYAWSLPPFTLVFDDGTTKQSFEVGLESLIVQPAEMDQAAQHFGYQSRSEVPLGEVQSIITWAGLKKLALALGADTATAESWADQVVQQLAGQ